MQKKGQINKLTGFALSLIVFALVLAIGLSVMSKMFVIGRTTASNFDTNTTFTALNSTWVNIVELDQLSCSGIRILNGSNRVDVTSSFRVNNGCLVSLTDNTINNTIVTANYTYTYYEFDASSNSTGSMINSTSEIPSWIPVIIVAMIGGIVLFLVIKQFGGN